MELLIDMGASYSLLKADVVKDEVRSYILEPPIKIEGIGDGYKTAKYWTWMNFNDNIRHKFLIIPSAEDWNFEEDGILGSDFFDKHKASEPALKTTTSK